MRKGRTHSAQLSGNQKVVVRLEIAQMVSMVTKRNLSVQKLAITKVTAY